MSIDLICAIGIGTVFAGLICLILISYIMSFFCQKMAKPKAQENPVSGSANVPVTPKTSNVPAQIPNKQEIVAAVCAVIAEELGTDVSNIRVTSFKRV